MERGRGSEWGRGGDDWVGAWVPTRRTVPRRLRGRATRQPGGGGLFSSVCFCPQQLSSSRVCLALSLFCLASLVAIPWGLDRDAIGMRPAWAAGSFRWHRPWGKSRHSFHFWSFTRVPRGVVRGHGPRVAAQCCDGSLVLQFGSRRGHLPLREPPPYDLSLASSANSHAGNHSETRSLAAKCFRLVQAPPPLHQGAHCHRPCRRG